MDASEPDVYADPASVLRRFIADMNAWEVATPAKYRATPPADHQQFWAEATDALRVVFARWCTPKKRPYGRLGSFQDPPEYQPGQEEVGDVVVESARRASVYTQRRTGFAFQRKYVLLRQGGRWLLDSVKRRPTDADEWRNGIL